MLLVGNLIDNPGAHVRTPLPTATSQAITEIGCKYCCDAPLFLRRSFNFTFTLRKHNCLVLRELACCGLEVPTLSGQSRMPGLAGHEFKLIRKVTTLRSRTQKA